jgi:transposase
MGEQRRLYPAELKRDALEMLKGSGKSTAAVARDLGIDSGLLNRWRREEAQEGTGKKAFPGQGNPRDEELVKLRKEVADLRETNEILKKVVAIFSVKENRE